MIQKTIIILILGGVGGAGFFLSGPEMGNSFSFFNSEISHGAKKKNLVKPKSFYSKRKARLVSFQHDKLSFFPVLNDPSLSKMMGLNGQIIRKTSYFPAPARVVRPEKRIRKKPPVSAPARIEKTSLKTAILTLPSIEPKKARVKARPKPSESVSEILKGFPVLSAHVDTDSSGTRVGSKPALLKGSESLKAVGKPFPAMVSFVVQVSSFRQMQRAEVLKNALGKKGYASFIGTTKLPGNKGTWYRVHIGRYLDHAGALTAAKKYYRKENRKAMVIRQSG